MCLGGTSKWRCGDLLEPRRACRSGYYLPWSNLCPYVHLVWNTFPINSALARSMSLSARSATGFSPTREGTAEKQGFGTLHVKLLVYTCREWCLPALAAPHTGDLWDHHTL